MQRILHVTQAMNGGCLQSVATICKCLSGKAELYVLHARQPETPDDLYTLYPRDVTFIEWQAGREINPLKDWASLRQLKRVVAEIQPDIIHAHSSKAGALVRLAFPAGRAPAVCYSPRGYAFLRRDVPAPMRGLFHALEWVLGRTGGLTIACGVGEYSLAIRHARHAILIENSVPMPDMPGRTHEARAPGVLDVVTAGRISPQKNFPQFVDVARRLETDNINFTWIGDGEHIDRGALPKNVTITGWLPRAQVLERLTGADLYLQTSRWEGLSLALIEAMMLGLPLLANPCIGNNELIVDGENGYLCDSTDAFVQRLRACRDDRTHLADMGRESRRMAMSRYTIEHAAPRWRSLYRFIGRYQTYS